MKLLRKSNFTASLWPGMESPLTFTLCMVLVSYHKVSQGKSTVHSKITFCAKLRAFSDHLRQKNKNRWSQERRFGPQLSSISWRPF